MIFPCEQLVFGFLAGGKFSMFRPTLLDIYIYDICITRTFETSFPNSSKLKAQVVAYQVRDVYYPSYSYVLYK